ncbi:MAG: hypothetical protein U0838_12065 [Chloroflexota bacterium]
MTLVRQPSSGRPGGGVRSLARGAPAPSRLTPPSSDFERVPPERRAQTFRRMVGFFRPYRAQVLVVLVAILATSFSGCSTRTCSSC